MFHLHPEPLQLALNRANKLDDGPERAARIKGESTQTVSPSSLVARRCSKSRDDILGTMRACREGRGAKSLLPTCGKFHRLALSSFLGADMTYVLLALVKALVSTSLVMCRTCMRCRYLCMHGWVDVCIYACMHVCVHVCM